MATGSGWYIRRMDGPSMLQAGPFVWEELCAHARAGAIDPRDLVQDPQHPDWVPAAEIPGLLPGYGVAAPAAVAPIAQPQAPVAAQPGPEAQPTANAQPEPEAQPHAAAQAEPEPQPAAAPENQDSYSLFYPALVVAIAIVVIGAALAVYFLFL
jgi:hypothetical protein